jgi:hypothetical protein
MEAPSEVLDRVLLELCGLDQLTPVEHTKFIRLMVRLHVDPLDNYRQPEPSRRMNGVSHALRHDERNVQFP